MTPLLWVIVGAIIVKLSLLIPLGLSIRESHTSIKRSNAILNQKPKEQE